MGGDKTKSSQVMVFVKYVLYVFGRFSAVRVQR